MGIFTKKTPEELAADKVEKERKRKENAEQQAIFRDAFNKGRREQLIIEGEKKGKLSAQKSGSGGLSGILNTLGSERVQNIGAGANAYIMEGLDGPTRRKRK